MQESKLEIITLGKFEVRRAGQLLSQDSSYRVWNLFKYIITNRNTGIVPELALENLWPDQEYSDPRGAVRALIFRLRKSLGQNPGTAQDYIVFSQGCYHWNKNVDYWLDAEEFENMARRALTVKHSQPQHYEDLLLQAVDLYGGEYLPESYYRQWTIPVRNYLNSLYLQVVLELMELLAARGDYSKIITICEQVLRTHSYEEQIHRYYLKALVNEGRIKQARSHYTYIDNKFYQDLGIKLSADLQRTIQAPGNRQPGGVGLNSIQNHLQEKADNQGAFICDSEVFKDVYNLERRRGERLGLSVFLALVTIMDDTQQIDSSVVKKGMDELESFLVKSLRKGDVITRWSNNQYLLMLPGMADELGEKVMERIKNGFNQTNQHLTINTEIQPVLPPEIYN